MWIVRFWNSLGDAFSIEFYEQELANKACTTWNEVHKQNDFNSTAFVFRVK